MEFVTPLMLAGLIGIGIPVALHLTGRRRAKVVPFAALHFLLGSNKKTARRLQVRELLLLIIRALVCLAIPLALAKPFTQCTASGPSVSRGPQAAVLIIDNGFGSRYELGEETLLSRAKQRGLDILRQLGPEADAAVMLAAAGSESPAELSRDHIRLRDRIAGIESSARPTDLTVALRRAAQLLDASNHQRKVVYLISPLARSSFAAEPPWEPGEGPALSIVDVRDEAVLDNVAIVDLTVTPDSSSGARGVQVTAEVANYGSSAVDDRELSLQIDGEVLARGLVTLRPGEHLRKQFTATLPTGVRSADIVVSLPNDKDPLSIDNRRYVRTRLRDEVSVLLVNGDPRTVRHDDELFYIEAALRPGDRADSGTVITTATVDELDELDPTRFDTIVLANVRALSEARVARLAKWVDAGGGLFITVGDQIDADTYNATMAPLLPQTLRTLLDVGYGASGGERQGRALRLSKWDSNHPIFTIFAKDAPGVREASFDKIMLLGPTTDVAERQVLARYTNGAAALVEARKGRGRLLLLTSTIDRDWNDLAIHPGFLPLVQQSVRHLARKQSRRDEGYVLVGRSAVLDVEPDDARIEVRAPDGTATVIEGEALADRKTVRISETQRPGFYRVLSTDKADRERRRNEADFAVNIDASGSDLRPIAAADLPSSGSATAATLNATHKKRVELWHAVAVGLLALLVVESLLVLRS